MVCVDNSEWTRNGDFAPTRWQAQADAVNLLAGAKTQANPENTVRQRRSLLQCTILFKCITSEQCRGLRSETSHTDGCPELRSHIDIDSRTVHTGWCAYHGRQDADCAGDTNGRPGEGAELDARPGTRGRREPRQRGADCTAGSKTPSEQEPAPADRALCWKPCFRDLGTSPSHKHCNTATHPFKLI